MEDNITILNKNRKEFILRDDKNRVSPKLRKDAVPNIKSKLYILFKVELNIGGVKNYVTILGNSKFEIFNNDVDYERGFNQALFNMYYLADNRGFGYDVKVFKVKKYGYSQAKGVKTKRVKRRGKYYNYTYIKGIKGVVAVSKWSNKKNTIIDEEIKKIENEDLQNEFNKNM